MFSKTEIFAGNLFSFSHNAKLKLLSKILSVKNKIGKVSDVVSHSVPSLDFNAYRCCLFLVTELVWYYEQNEIPILEESISNTNFVLLNYLLPSH